MSLGGKKLPWSDMGYELSAFECIPVRFLFWEGDEEFPAQGNLLFDAGVTDFIHGESIVTIASVGLSRLAPGGRGSHGFRRFCECLKIFSAPLTKLLSGGILQIKN